MNYYIEIKENLINNEVYKKVKDYSKNRSDLDTYYKVGKLLSLAGKHYGEGIIKEYSKKLTNELGKKYSVRYLFDMKHLYLFSKVHPLDAQLSMSHYRILFRLNNKFQVNYYICQVIKRKLSKRDLEKLIINKEYERLPEETKNKLINQTPTNAQDLIPNPIIIQNINNIGLLVKRFCIN